MTKPQKLLVLSVVILLAPAAAAKSLDGTVEVGGIFLDETGDQTAVQETFNIYDGFSLNRIRLNGTSDANDRFTFDLREINLDSRQGRFTYRRPGLFKVTADFDQSRWVFSPDAAVDSRRRDWKVGAQYSPKDWLRVSGNFNYLTRDGDRASYPAGTIGVVGTSYDTALKSGRFSVQANKDRYGGAVSYDVSSFTDELNGGAERSGQVLSARVNAPGMFYNKWTHVLRGSYGVSRLKALDIDYMLYTLRYTGIIAPIDALQFKYGFDARRVEHENTDLKTDRFQNSLDATVFHRYGQVSGGYVFETNDDDYALTYYHGWRGSTVFRLDDYVTARFEYAGRTKTDEEKLTLLKDVEASRIRAKLSVHPIDAITVGGGYSWREREFPDIRVRTEGDIVNGFVRFKVADWGTASGEFSHSEDTYDDLAAGFGTENNVVTGRVGFDRIENLHLGGGLTYLDIGGDLDIEKSMVFVEAEFKFLDKYSLEARYNVFNYDDYVLVDRYYTANVVWVNVGYDFSVK